MAITTDRREFVWHFSQTRADIVPIEWLSSFYQVAATDSQTVVLGKAGARFGVACLSLPTVDSVFGHVRAS